MEAAGVNLEALPLWQCHKRVRAVKIETLDHLLEGGGSINELIGVSAEYMTKHKPQPGGYWVKYDDGYSSYSPAAAFEGGYTLIPATSTASPIDHIMQFFAFAHLPAKLAAVSQPFSVHAWRMIETLPRNPERTVALRKLLEAKDAAVRALLAKD